MVTSYNTITAGFRAIPIDSPDEDVSRHPVHLCVLASIEPDASQSYLVRLRQHAGVSVYLGVMVDARNSILQWLEVWVQNVSGLSESLFSARSGATNTSLDQRWKATVKALAALPDSGGMVFSGWELRRTGPLVLDVADGNAGYQKTDDGTQWLLCVDDDILIAAGLPAYSDSLHRYLVAGTGPAARFMPVTDQAPTTDRCTAKPEWSPSKTALNAEGGYLVVRRHSPVSLEAFIEILSGRPVDGLRHGAGVVPLPGAFAALTDSTRDGGNSAPAEGFIFLGRHGRKGRVVESFHLKLRLLADLVKSVEAFVRATARPMFSICPDSFEVQLIDPGSGLPTLWGSRAVLHDPGDAVMLPIPGAAANYFQRQSTGASIYHPESAGEYVQGQCSLRIRQVIPDAGTGVIVEGTLTTAQRFTPGPQDLICLRPALASGVVELFARLDESAAHVGGEHRFRTIGQALSATQVAELTAAAGVSMPRVGFESVPLVSSPCDLYALAVLAVQTMLTHPQRSPLPVALDEMLSLGRKVALQFDGGIGLGLRIRGLFEQEPHWMKTLGPQQLFNEPISPEEALDLIPADLWWDLLACILRMFPGLGPDSTCAHFGDAPPLALHSVFARSVAGFDSLIERTRSLIVIDWQYNREIQAVIRGKK